MAIVHAVIALALIQLFVFGMLVGRARVKYGVLAPAVAGHPVFERYYRVHYNTLEQIVCLVPGMLLFGTYVSAPVAAGLGLVFVVARIFYLRGYVADPKKRGAGFGISALPVMVLLAGGLIGAIVAAVA
jgi:hypothetical protein